ncbi:MAG: CotH kinase family protein [Eubacteriales bacterium]
MRTIEKNVLILMLAICLILPILSSCRTGESASSDGTGQTDTDVSFTRDPDNVTPEVTVPPVSEQTSPDGKAKVIYAVSGPGGSLDGKTEQTPGSSGTTEVKAVADVGYCFKSWSDGLTETTRKGDTSSDGVMTTIYAVFEPEYLEMPVINITTETGEDVDPRIGNQVYIGATLSLTNCPADYALTDVTMQMRGRGNFSWYDVPKKSYKLKLTESQNLLGLGEGKSKSWCLIANHCDQSLLRNYLTYQLCRGLSGLDWAPDCTNVEVYLNGEYRGVYLLVESIKVDEHRVAISEDVEAGTDIGYLLQMTNNSDETYHFNSNGFNFDVKSDLSASSSLADQQLSYIRSYVNNCWTAVMGGDQEEIEALMDLDSVIDSYLVEEFNKNLDVGYDSFYLYKDSGGKLTFGPVWDFDLAFGNSNEHGCELAEGLYTGIDYCNHYHSNEWYTYLMSYDWFRERVAERWNSQEVQTVFGGISALATETAQKYYNSFCRNFKQWEIFGQQINRETWRITSLMSYTEHYQYLAQWISDRFDWLNGFIGSNDYNKGNLYGSGELQLPDPPKNPVISIPAFSGGSGTVDSPYLIANAQDFVSFTQMLYATDFDGTYFLQTADLDLSSVNGYKGIGSSATFAGVYDGGGYAITAHIDSSDGCIFPYVSGLLINVITKGSVKNTNQAAGICRSVRQGGALINCASFMDVTSTGGNAGGLSPSTQGGDSSPAILNCFFFGTVNGFEQSSPINCWLAGRFGHFAYIYYSETLDNGFLTVSEDDICLTADQMKNELADLLNGNIASLSDALTPYGLGTDALCRWQKNGDCPVMQTKGNVVFAR